MTGIPHPRRTPSETRTAGARALDRRTVIRGAVLLGVGAAAGGADLLAGPPASGGLAAAANPGIASCATWGARSPGALTVIGSNPNKIIVHHTATANSSDFSQAHAYALARSIQAFHMDSNGWADTGQHFTVSRGGYAMEGRHNSLSRLDAGSGMVVGAHCPGQNDQAIGIENEGTYTSVAPTSALYSKLVALCAYICDQYGIAASRIHGHRDFVATACPGNVLYSMLPQLRTDVANALNPPTSWTSTVDNSTAGRFSASANWGTSTFSSQRFGADYRFATPLAASDPAWYRFAVPATGTYRVDVWHPADPGYNSAAPYVVVASGGNQTITVDQRGGGGAWRSLGTFAITAGDKNVVGVSRWTSAAGYVIADAVRLTRV